jgi:hypothetical protein
MVNATNHYCLNGKTNRRKILKSGGKFVTAI